MFKLTIIKTAELIALKEELKRERQAFCDLQAKSRLKDVQIEILRDEKKELYDKIHNKPKDQKGKFCKKAISHATYN